MNLVLPADAGRDAAVAWLREFVRDFGPGFHLDSPPEDYVLADGRPVFNRDESRQLRTSLEQLFRILGNALPYEIGADAVRSLLDGPTAATPDVADGFGDRRTDC